LAISQKPIKDIGLVQQRKMLVQAINRVQASASRAVFEFRLQDVSPDSRPIARNIIAIEENPAGQGLGCCAGSEGLTGHAVS